MLNSKEISKFLILFLILIFQFTLVSKNNQVKEIDVILSSNSSIYIKTINNLQTNLNANFKLHFLSSIEKNQSKNFFEKLEKNSSDYIITLGYQATSQSLEYVKKKKIIYTLVNSPVVLNHLEVDNVCGINSDPSVDKFLEIVKEINPNAKNVISFFSSESGEILAKEGFYLADKFDILYNAVETKNKESIKNYLNKNKDDIEAIYLVPDPVLDKEVFDFISTFSKDNNIILMTPIPYLINLGVTFSITPFYSRIGILLGELSEKVSNGEDICKNNKIFHVQEYSFQLNKDYSKKSGLNIPENLVLRSENNSILLEGISQMEGGNIELAGIIMNEIIKKDPGNKTAKFFRDLSVRKLNKDKIQKYYKDAEEFLDKKMYSKARESFQKILTITPFSEDAKKGIENTLFLESEVRRRKGELNEKKGENIQAIIDYSDALKIYKQNDKAKKSLEALKQKERRNIPYYKEIASKYYNNRNYQEAENKFKEILLIDPSDKYASEYFQLSENKKRGMQKYLDCIKKNDKKCSLIWKEKK
ncbi:MAG: hypothetical protein KDK36_06595 [Leptospiraceae bacterium]|nr:hypothetical protein [Leptospiraceae bacterium]